MIIALTTSCGQGPKEGLDAATNLATTGSTEGSKGDKGDAGKDGKNGKDGGKGEAGRDGASAYTVNVVDLGGLIVGSLYGYDTTNTKYWVTRDKVRYDIDRVNGTFPQGWIFYSGANCTGIKRVGIINGQFADVVIEPQTNAVLRAKGVQINNFAYASRRAAGSCANTSSTANRVFDYEDVTTTLPFAYPVNSPELENAQ